MSVPCVYNCVTLACLHAGGASYHNRDAGHATPHPETKQLDFQYECTVAVQLIAATFKKTAGLNTEGLLSKLGYSSKHLFCEKHKVFMEKNRDLYDPSVFVVQVCGGVTQLPLERENISVDED